MMMMMTLVYCMTTVRNRRAAYGVTSTLNKASLIPPFMLVRMGMMRMTSTLILIWIMFILTLKTLVILMVTSTLNKATLIPPFMLVGMMILILMIMVISMINFFLIFPHQW